VVLVRNEEQKSKQRSHLISPMLPTV